MEKIIIALPEEKEIATRIENNIKAKCFKYVKRGSMGNVKLIVEVANAQDAYFLGMNVVAIMHKLFDTGTTRTGRG